MGRIVPAITGAVEGVSDDAVARRIVEHLGGEVAAMHVSFGKANLRPRVQSYNNAARFSPWVVLVDLDGDAECGPELRRQWLPDAHPRMCFRVAVRTIESWLLADREAMSKFLSVPVSKIPPNPETLPNAKQFLVSLAGQSRKKAIREDMVPRPGSGRMVGPAFTSRIIEFASAAWRPDAAEQVSESLAGCMASVRELLQAEE